MVKKIKDPDINITQLARRTGYDRTHLNRVMCGERQPSVTCLRKVSKSLRITMEQTLTVIQARKRYNKCVECVYAEGFICTDDGPYPGQYIAGCYGRSCFEPRRLK